MVVEKYPEGEYTDQAYYWLGESLQAQHQNEASAEAFKYVSNRFTKSTKHAAALIKLSDLYIQLDKKGDAKAMLERVIKEHPDTIDAEHARGKLLVLSQAVGAKDKQ
jgi:tol-pal system protein YbgF